MSNTSAVERRKEESEGDSADVFVVDNYNSKTKKRHKSKAKDTLTSGNVSKVKSSFQASFEVLLFDLKSKPKKTIKRLVVKIGLYLWSLAVVFSVLSLMGVPVSSFFSSSSSFSEPQQTSRPESKARILRASDSESSNEVASAGGFWASFSNTLFSSTALLETSKSSSDGYKKSDSELNDGETEVEENIPQQILPAKPKEGNKLDRKLEKELACEEDGCNIGCNRKIKPKCAKSLSCKKEREKLCKRRCRKQRCEDRCKDEPKFGYVEREQRMEKCKDECTGPIAAHNKCIKKCHSQFKPCKSRCHEIASKYVCDKAKDNSLLEIVVSEEEEEEADEDAEMDDQNLDVDSDEIADDEGEEDIVRLDTKDSLNLNLLEDNNDDFDDSEMI